MRTLIIEDDPSVIRLVAQTIATKWVDVNLISADHGGEGVELARKELPDIIILDLVLPVMDGFKVLQQIRSFSDALVVILTGKGDEDDRIKGLQEGADEYIVKPFSAAELVARMKALIRRREITKAMAGVTGKPATRQLSIDFENETATVGGKLLRMGPSQYELFYLLVTNEGKALSKQFLLQKVFPEHGDDAKIVNVFIDKIRQQLEEYPNNPKIIIDDGTSGYKFVGSYSLVREALKESES